MIPVAAKLWVKSHISIRISKVGENLSLANKFNQKVNHVFVFLEIFVHEGGIQSYVKDILHAYQKLSPGYQYFACLSKIESRLSSRSICTA